MGVVHRLCVVLLWVSGVASRATAMEDGFRSSLPLWCVAQADRLHENNPALVSFVDNTLKIELQSPESYVDLALRCDTSLSPRDHQYQVVKQKEYEHDPSMFLQGLFFYDGELFESSGIRTRSAITHSEWDSLKLLKKERLEKSVFGEGSTYVVKDGKVYMYVLSWQAGKGYIYDIETFEVVEEWHYDGEGWGLTTMPDGRLVMSDGSNELRILKIGDDLHPIELERIPVTVRGKGVQKLNELEYINGRIWANVWLKEEIVVIDILSDDAGTVIAVIDGSTLWPQHSNSQAVNGIAWNNATGELLLTGKKWPRMYLSTFSEPSSTLRGTVSTGTKVVLLAKPEGDFSLKLTSGTNTQSVDALTETTSHRGEKIRRFSFPVARSAEWLRIQNDSEEPQTISLLSLKLQDSSDNEVSEADENLSLETSTSSPSDEAEEGRERVHQEPQSETGAGLKKWSIVVFMSFIVVTLLIALWRSKNA